METRRGRKEGYFGLGAGRSFVRGVALGRSGRWKVGSGEEQTGHNLREEGVERSLVGDGRLQKPEQFQMAKKSPAETRALRAAYNCALNPGKLCFGSGASQSCI